MLTLITQRWRIHARMRIITHNTYWFQGAPSRWGDERVADVPEVFAALVELYGKLQPDVLCLQEVHRAELAEGLAIELGMSQWLHVPGGQRRDYGGAVLSRGEADFRDCTTLDRQVHERCHVRATVNCDGETIEIAAIHLPSNRFAGSPAGGERARVAELGRVLAVAPLPDIVLGDMNCVPDSDTYRQAMQAGYRDAATAGPGPALPKRVDHVWLARRLADRLRSFTCIEDGDFVRVDPDGRRWRLSDHPILVVELA